MTSILDNITARKSEGGEELEPKDDEYRAVWRMAHPAAFELRLGPLWKSVSYGHVLYVITAATHFTGLWIITPDLTFALEGERLREVATSLTDRKARAITLFEPAIHKKWDEKGAIIRVAQPIAVRAEIAVHKAAELFGFTAVLPAPASEAGSGEAPPVQ